MNPSNRMDNLIRLLVITALLPPLLPSVPARGQVAAGGEARAKSPGQTQPAQGGGATTPRARGGGKPKAGAAERVQRRTQAVDILKGVVERAGDIKEAGARAAVVADALDLLWKHDESYARVNFVRSADGMLEKFASDETKGQERAELRSALGVLLKAFARRDPQESGRLLDRFQKLLEDAMKGGPGSRLSARERLSLAQAGLDSDPAQSAALAGKVIESGVPGSFPEYLNELERRDPAAAASVFRTALSILGGGAVYSPQQATILSAYAFREAYMSVPVAGPARDGAPPEFGMFASPLSPPGRDLNPALAGAYLAAAGAFLNAQSAALEQRGELEAGHVATGYFLVKKLRGYADKLGLGGGQPWAALEAKFLLLAERAKLGDSSLGGLAASAQRIVTDNSVFRFDGGAAALAAAEKAGDPDARAELLAQATRQLVEEGRYAEAAWRIPDVRNERFREQLTDFLHFHAAGEAIRKLDWDGVNDQVNRVADARLRSYLLLSAAQAAVKAKKKELASGFLHAVMSLLTKLEDADARAGALVTTAGILPDVDAAWGAQVLADGVKAINRADRYDGVYGVTLEAPKYKLYLPFPNSDLGRCFERAAKHDWPGTLATAQGINSKLLQSQAYIGACRGVL